LSSLNSAEHSDGSPGVSAQDAEDGECSFIDFKTESERSEKLKVTNLE